MRRAFGVAQRLLYRRERALVVVVAAHVTEPGQKMVEGTPVIDPPRSLNAVLHPLVQALRTPIRGGQRR